ncbi:MAG TPA: hypothetical protein VNO32_49780, partial [Candidatus Acidoferrum sp.]|nr:hypothetical protein [Candidatus Acidoferrum sp.]
PAQWRAARKQACKAATSWAQSQLRGAGDLDSGGCLGGGRLSLVATLESDIAAVDAMDSAEFSADGENRRTTASDQPAGYDYRLRSRERVPRKRIYGSTKPGTLLKQQIPVKTDRWDVQYPDSQKLIWCRIRGRRRAAIAAIP